MEDSNARAPAEPESRDGHGSELATARGSKYRSKTGPHFGGQLFERFGGRTSRPEQRSQLPQGCDFGFCGDRVPGRDGVLSLLGKALRAKQRFGESTLHFVLQQGERVLSSRPWRSAWEEPQNLALTPMRLEARTTAGAQTASEARPWRN